jgi:hypothetical protein
MSKQPPARPKKLPTNAGKNPEKYAGWSKQRRFDAAVRKVVHDSWTQTEAALEFGVSRSRLNPKVQEYRREHEARLAQAKVDQAGPMLQGALGPLGLQERRRVPMTFQEFDDYYFAHWTCPDCSAAEGHDVRHQRMPFHDQIIEAIEGDYRRVVINTPPYHAKTTYGTVKDSVYRLVQNPNWRRILVSKSTEFAKTFLYSIDQMFTNPDLYLPDRNLIADWGPFKPEGGSSVWNQNQIYVAGRMSSEKDPSLQVTGVGKQIYGKRADDILADDVADVDNSRNPEMVRKQLEWFDKMAATRVGRAGKIVWIGTRVNPGDIYSVLKMRSGYKVVSLSAIIDDVTEEVLWPEHFPYSQLMIHRDEMLPADFQLIYQNVDVPGLGASFTQEMIDQCKDRDRIIGQFDSSWRLVAGLDLAGANKDSGYTAMTLIGIDVETGMRYIVDQVAVKAMKAPQLKEQMFAWTDMYPISEWRVEVNGVQANLVQYNDEIIKKFAQRGVRVVPHTTHKNKWDPQFGVESTAPLFGTGQISIPWGNAPTAKNFQPFVEELIAFPLGTRSDRVMSFWFADLGCRDYLRRGHLPMFNDRMRVPDRIRRRRRVVDFEKQEVRSIPLEDQRGRFLVPGQRGERIAVGRPRPGGGRIQEDERPERRRYLNVAGSVGFR